MIKRQYGEFTTLETRHDSNETVDRRVRYRQIIDVLKEHRVYICRGNELGMTAKQIAVEMQKKGYIPTSERNFTAPRLTELSKKGVVEPIGKECCIYTGKMVTVYGLTDEFLIGDIEL